ncbi:pyridoxal-phosphate dependent enzyme [Pedobacter heparinus]|uniref:pyridoxal-phosphate dependent enzyme n=1 Tax=Pedobacter heparinus TaxID=984 RepID=UPI00292E3677|nr:pyridoxal-phosphate dependent enzyme [Pedobacter heparinus]
MWKYQSFLPPVSKANRISMGEGQTPLVKSRSIGPALGIPDLYFKLENLNPTGSYKDRFASTFVSMMKSRNQDFCIATSSGNTGAALAAYCAAANIRCMITVVDGAPEAKIKQMQVYGASMFMVKDFGKDPELSTEVFSLLNSFALSVGLPLPVSAYCYCPEGMQGVQTIAYEIFEQTANTVDHIFCPAGGGGLTLSLARGVKEYGHKYQLSALPRVHCVQPEGNDTMVSPLRNKEDVAVQKERSTTIISGLQVPNVLDGNEVITACRSLGGTGYAVADDEVFNWHKKMAQQEGIFCEPAGAVALAGLALAIEKGEVAGGEQVVCLVTGSGFKDMLAVERQFALPGLAAIDKAAFALWIEKIKNEKSK